MKKCNRCKLEKNLAEFHRHRNRRDGYQPYCKACKKADDAAYYRTKTKQWENYNLTRKKKYREWYFSLKQGPCVDCGQTFDPICMDFDHRPDEEKTFVISTAALGSVGRERLLAEIAKCDLVCANCHRLRTKKRYRYYP